jgi:hypothetical protein
MDKELTQDELDALPEDDGPLYQGDDDYFLISDRQGRLWMTGWVGYVQYKRRLLGLEVSLKERP